MESLWKTFKRPEFLRQFWTLVRLRYQLIWAHARTGSGKVALLFALYLLGGMLALLFTFGGLGASIAAIELGRGESVARWMLSSLFANGIGLSLLFGLGPRSAFAEDSLRRYPLSAQERFGVRHVIGLLDPTWLILIAGAVGMAVGFVWLGAGSLVTGIPAALLFIIANYLATAVLLSIIGVMMATRLGATVLGALMILLVSFGPLAVASLVTAQREIVWRALDRVLQFTPPGAAASMIAGDEPLRVLFGLGLLLFWCAILISTLGKLERRPRAVEEAPAGRASWNDFYDQFGNLFGRRYGPLASKSLRYHLRCNLVRFSLVTSPTIVLMGKFLIPGAGPGGFFQVSLMIFFIMSSATGAALMLNQFGYDGAGIRRYAVMPMPLADALRAGAFASLMLRAVAVCVAIALWLAFYNSEVLTWRMLVMILSIALASLLLFNALGFWTSIYAAKSADFDAMWNNRLSFGANVVVIGGILIPLWGTMFIANRIGQSAFLRFWWIPILALLLCAGFFALTMRTVDKPLNARREKLINLIAGARDS